MQVLATASGSVGLNISADGPADVLVLDNVFLVEAGAVGSTAFLGDFNNETVITVGGTADNIYPQGIPDDANLSNPNLPLGNLFIMNADSSRALDLDFARTSTATIENNLVDNTQGTNVLFVEGIVLTTREALSLNGGIDNLVFLDVVFNNGNGNFTVFQSQQGTGANWFILNGAGVVDGSILVNGVPQP